MPKNNTSTSTDKSTQTGTTQGSAATQANAQTLWNLGMNQVNNGPTAYNPNALSAGLTPDQQDAFSLIRNNTGAGTGQLNSATGLATQAGGYTPQAITPGVSAGAQAIPLDIGRASAGPAAVGGVATSSNLPSVDLSGYLNPFTKDVIDTSLASINDQQGQAQAADAGAAAAHGAFGDARSGVQAALTSSLFDKNKQATIANLNSGNFTQATGNAEADLQRAAGVSTSNAGNATTASIANTNAGTQANIASAANNLGLAGENAQLAQGNNQFNVNTGLTAAINNANNGLTGNAQTLGAASTLGNLGMATQSQALNSANALGAAGAVAQNTNQAGLTAQYQEFLRQQGWTDQQIQQLGGIYGATAPAFGQTATSTTNSTNTKSTPSSLIPSLLGAGLSLIPGGSLVNSIAGGAIAGGATDITPNVTTTPGQG